MKFWGWILACCVVLCAGAVVNAGAYMRSSSVSYSRTSGGSTGIYSTSVKVESSGSYGSSGTSARTRRLERRAGRVVEKLAVSASHGG